MEIIYLGKRNVLGWRTKPLERRCCEEGEYARKAALNTSVALGSAAIPVAGWMVGGVYFLGEALIPKDANGVSGWERGMEASRQNVQNNREIDPTWSPRPMGGL
jgi:hypothetical protein